MQINIVPADRAKLEPELGKDEIYFIIMVNQQQYLAETETFRFRFRFVFRSIVAVDTGTSSAAVAESWNRQPLLVFGPGPWTNGYDTRYTGKNMGS